LRATAPSATTTAIAAFVTLRAGVEPTDALVEDLRDHVAKLIGPIAKPKSILFTEELPKTRSGKIMRRLLRNVAEDEALGDVTTLADPAVVDGIKSRYLSSQPSEE
jgi:acetyl-CoA synthetase